MISTEQIKELRDRTGMSVMQCKKALEEASGDMEKALILLREAGVAVAAKKSDRALGAGLIASYIHNTKQIGVIVELDCETDFVAKNEEFGKLAYDIAMQVAAANPTDVTGLLEQPFIKDSNLTIMAILQGATQKFGEKIEIRRFSRYSTLD